MRKLHLGCGPHRLEGWENFDRELDITKRLPFEDSSVDLIFSEHVVEHILPTEAWGYFEECFRILKPGGVVRTTVPDISKAWEKQTPEYLRFVKDRGWGDGSPKSGIRHLVFNHGHQSLWTASILSAMQSAIGFKMYQAHPYFSYFSTLWDLEQHGIDLGRENNIIESVSTDGLKP